MNETKEEKRRQLIKRYLIAEYWPREDVSSWKMAMKVEILLGETIGGISIGSDAANVIAIQIATLAMRRNYIDEVCEMLDIPDKAIDNFKV